MSKKSRTEEMEITEKQFRNGGKVTENTFQSNQKLSNYFWENQSKKA